MPLRVDDGEVKKLLEGIKISIPMQERLSLADAEGGESIVFWTV